MNKEDIIGQNQGITNQSKNVTSVPSSTPVLPYDVIIEILTWLPVMALLRFKTVCKDWKAIIESHDLKFKHYNRSLPCVVADRLYEYSDDLELRNSDTYESLGIYYGMIVERGISHRKYRISNPATCRVIELPDPCETVFGLFLCQLPSPSDFKLISLYYYNQKEAGNGCQILSLDGSDNPSWRTLRVPNLHELGGGIWIMGFVLIGQVVHCVMGAGSVSKVFLHVLSLDIEKEGFISIITPHNCFTYLGYVQPFQYNGELAFAELVKEWIQIYTLEAHENLVKKVVLPLLFFKENPEMMENLVMYAIRGSEVWFDWFERRKLFVYDIVLGRITYLKALEECPHVPYVREQTYSYPFKPSLFGIKRMGPTLRIEPNGTTKHNLSGKHISPTLTRSWARVTMRS